MSQSELLGPKQMMAAETPAAAAVSFERVSGDVLQVITSSLKLKGHCLRRSTPSIKHAAAVRHTGCISLHTFPSQRHAPLTF